MDIIFKLYVICNPKVVFRKNNMIRRVTNIGLFEKTTFVEGGDVFGDLCKYYANKKELIVHSTDGGSDIIASNGVTGCLVGHLRALREFVDDNISYGIILEDDILFRMDFAQTVEKLIANHPEEKLIQLFNISGTNYTRCQVGGYGTQGYIITRQYAIEALIKYDKPHRYWDPDIFYTSEAITMYSGGLCLQEFPIIEDGLTYTCGGNGVSQYEPNEYQILCQQYSYAQGLHLYIDCDPEFKLPAIAFRRLAPSILNYSVTDIDKILKHCDVSKNDEDELVVHLFYMLSGWYVDRNNAIQHAYEFFKLSYKGTLAHTIREWKILICETARFYQPEVKKVVEPDELKLVTWENDMNWMLIPNAV